MSATISSKLTAESTYTTEKDKLDEKYGLHAFTHVGPPSEDIAYVSLQAIDLGKFQEGSSPEAVASRKELAKELDLSLRTHGFFFLTNHGVDAATIARLDSISQALHGISQDEKLSHRSAGLTSDEDIGDKEGAERGAGFKPRKYWSMANGVKDNIEFYNFTHIAHEKERWDQNHPEVAKAYLNEVANYYRFLHLSVLRRLTILCDIILELPEGTIYDRYYRIVPGDIQGSGGGFGRFMMYYGHSSEENKKTDDTWLRGHSDSTGFTFIVSQPMVSLQIRDYKTETWKYVPHVPGALVVNIGDAMEFITGGYWPSTIHRVVNPPASQQGHIRHSIIYFCKPSWETIIDPESLGSPLLERLSIKSPSEWERITYGEWDIEKGRLFGKTKVNNKPGEAPNPVQIRGRLAERWLPRNIAV